MQLFKRSQGKKFLAPASAARELMAFAKAGVDPSNLLLIATDPKTRDAISSLIYLTKVAIIISLLRGEAINNLPDSRQYQFVDSFEELVFADTPFEGHSELAELLTSLFTLAKTLDDIMTAENEAQMRTAIPVWCATWLGAISDDQNFIQRTIAIFGGELTIYLHSQMCDIGKLIKTLLYEVQ